MSTVKERAKGKSCIFLTLLITLLFCPPLINSKEFGGDEDDPEPQEKIAKLRELLQVEPLELPKLQGELELDGKLTEPLWDRAALYQIKLETYPALLKPSPVLTDVKIGLFEDSLLIGFIAHDPDPPKIQAPLRDRDSIDVDDYVGMSIDPSGKLLNTFEFYVNARGVQADWVRNRVDNTRSRDWDADWQSAAHIGEFGYSVEMLIPLSEIETPKISRPLKRIVLFKRHYPRAVRHYLTAVTTREAPEEQRAPKRSFVLVPGLTLLNNYTRDPETDTGWDTDYQSELSLDLGYRLLPSFGLRATFNPDFLEVEADLTDFNINDPFTPLNVEKRSFFLKDIENFGTPFDLVYTRNILDPVAGINASGTIEELTTGNFLVYDEELSVIVPGNLSSERVELETQTTSGAFRYRYDLGPGTTAGLISTIRTDGGDYYNVVGGADLFKRFTQSHYLRAQWAYSGTQYPQEFNRELCEEPDACSDPADTVGVPGLSPLNEQVLRAEPDRLYNDDAWQIRYRYDHRKGYFIARYMDVGEDFRGDLGYMSRVDYRLYSLSGGLNYYFGGGETGLSRFRPSLNFYRQDSQSGELITESRELWFNYWGLYQTWLRLGFRNRERTAKRFLQNTLEIENNSRYFTENQLEYRVETSVFKNFRFILAGKFGTQIDTDNYRLGDLIEVIPEIRWSPTTHIEVGLKNIYRQLDVDGGRLYTENYLGLNLLYHLYNGSFFRLTIIDDYLRRDPDLYLFEDVDEIDRRTTGEIVFAWKPTQLNTFFIGLKGGGIDTDQLERPSFDEATAYLKYKRSFRF